MNHTIEHRINKYIAKIQPIAEGERNGALYNLGLSLRTEFGLTGDALETMLREVNAEKCTPSLSESEIVVIAQSVDKSDKPIGETTFARNEQKKRKFPKSEQRTWYCTNADSVSVDTLLAKSVSVYLYCRANTPSGTFTVSEVLETFQTGGSGGRQKLDR